MKIKFTCNTCGESFNIDSSYLPSKKNLNCPNCSKEFPQQLLEKLIESVNNINSVRKSLEVAFDHGEPEIYTSYYWHFEFLETK